MTVTHAEVHARETGASWGAWFLDGVVTTVKGIAHHFFPFHTGDNTTVRMIKVGMRVTALALAGASFYFYPVPTLVAALGLVAFGLLMNKLSHVF